MTRAVAYIPDNLDPDRARRAALDFADRVGVSLISTCSDELDAYSLLVNGCVDVVIIPAGGLFRRILVVGGPVPALARPPSLLTRRPRLVG